MTNVRVRLDTSHRTTSAPGRATAPWAVPLGAAVAPRLGPDPSAIGVCAPLRAQPHHERELKASPILHMAPTLERLTSTGKSLISYVRRGGTAAPVCEEVANRLAKPGAQGARMRQCRVLNQLACCSSLWHYTHPSSPAVAGGGYA